VLIRRNPKNKMKPKKKTYSSSLRKKAKRTKEPTDLVNHPHDMLFKKSMSIKKVAQDFFKANLPTKIKNQINLNNIELYTTSFINKELKQRECDILYKTTTKDNQDCYIYLLAEHQSSPSRLLPLRIMEYKTSIMRNHFYQKKKYTKKRTAPIVISIIYYHSKKNTPYPYSLNVFDLFKNKKLAQQTYTAESILIDLSEYSDEKIKKEKTPRLLFFAHKNARKKDFLKHHSKELIFLITDYLKNFYEMTEEEDAEYRESILYYFFHILGKKKYEKLKEALEKNDFIRKEKIMTTIAESFVKKGEQKGILKGIKKGEKKGEQKGILKGETNIIAQMLLSGLSIEKIAEYTNFPIKEIKKIKKEKTKSFLSA
jgi:predicted transposase/invertase (TIGR01784 family)